MGENGNNRSVKNGGYNCSDSYSNKTAEKKKVKRNAYYKESYIIDRFDFMNIFSEMNGEFFYEKLVSRRGNVSMENAGNAEGAG